MVNTLGFSFRVVVQHGLFVCFFVFDDVVNSNNNFVPYGNQCFLSATPGHKRFVLAFKVTVFLPGCAPRAFYQGALQIFIPVYGGSYFFFPPLSLLPGLMPAQLLRCCSLGNWFMSAPTSLMMFTALS